MKQLLIVLLLLTNQSVFSYEKIELDIDSGTTFSITQFPAEGKKLLIWLPSERGFSNQLIPTAMNLALFGTDVWSINLHETYMVPTGRKSLQEVEIADLVDLVDVAEQAGFEQVYLLSSGRGTRLALMAAYESQLQNPDKSIIRGMLFFSPHIFKGYTEIGDSADFIEISALSNLPIYIFQEQYSTKYARKQEIVERLQQGGSPVYIELLQDIRGGFYMRPDDDLTQIDINMRDQLPHKLLRAVNLLSRTRASKLYKSNTLRLPEVEEESLSRLPQLHSYKGDNQAPLLKLPVKNGGMFDLSKNRNEVVLINFWASWCAPCVEEIPSLTRLQDKMKGLPFKIVAVNIGESEQTITDFQKNIPFDFDVLMDADGNAVRDWKVYAYPSNFVVDQQGVIQYAYRGALEWDADSIVSTIKSMIH